MTKLTVFGFIAAGIVAISAALLSPGAAAQEARPQPQVCRGPGFQGGQTITITNGVTLALPEGYSYDWTLTPPGPEPAPIIVCIVGTTARVFIGLPDCTELRRVNPSGEPTLDARLTAIVESCRLPAPRSGLPNSCRGQPQLGGTPIRLANLVQLTPPGGGSYVIGTLPPSFGALLFCYVEGIATVTISYADCSEVRRENPSQDPGTDYYLDLVVESCVKLVQPTIPPEQLIPIEPPANRITPPDTGTAGLRQLIPEN